MNPDDSPGASPPDSDEPFRLIVEHIAEVVWLADRVTRRWLYLNPAHERLWGIPREALYADPAAFLPLVHPDDRERVAARLRDVLEHIEADDRPDGEFRIVARTGNCGGSASRRSPSAMRPARSRGWWE
ncbi:MAG TPA: PAS domain-containing protein [Chloroflexota bacterium]|jgi:PAS domain S-box-containing protein